MIPCPGDSRCIGHCAKEKQLLTKQLVLGIAHLLLLLKVRNKNMHVFLLLYYYYYDELRKTVSVTRNIYIPEPGDIIFYAYPSEPEYR